MMRGYFLSCGIHFCEWMNDRFPQIMFRTPYSSIHDSRLSTKVDYLNDIPTRSFDGLNIESSCKSRGKSTTDMHGELAILTIDSCADGVITECTYLGPAGGKDRSYSFHWFEMLGGAESSFG